MALKPRIELVPGESGWLKHLRHALLLIAGISLLTSPLALSWKMATLTGLLVAAVSIHVYLSRLSRFKAIILLDNNLLTLVEKSGNTIPSKAGNHPWVSAWVCILPIIPTHSTTEIRLIVCRTLNRTNDYRRLLKMLRLDSVSRHQSGILDRK